VVVATGRQHLATIAAVAEALVNICLSIWLIQRMGAMGVAIGTVVGAFVSITLHLTVSMRYTRSAILIHRSQFIMQGLLRPLVCVAPSVILLPFWKRFATIPAPPLSMLLWALATIALAWQVGLNRSERQKLLVGFSRLAYWPNVGA